MTEKEWIEGANPVLMLRFLGSGGFRPPEKWWQRLGRWATLRYPPSLLRKFRAYAVQMLCQSMYPKLPPQERLEMVTQCNNWIDEPSTEGEYVDELQGAIAEMGGYMIWPRSRQNCVLFNLTDTGDETECRRYGALLRELFGNPFRPVRFTSLWLTSNVISLAESIYTGSAFDRLPILADALEDAGCTNADILNHCRQPSEHVRGCWVVDLVLGKK